MTLKYFFSVVLSEQHRTFSQKQCMTSSLLISFLVDKDTHLFPSTIGNSQHAQNICTVKSKYVVHLYPHLNYLRNIFLYV